MGMSGLFVTVIIILAGFTLHGYLKGMVRVIFSLVSIFLTIGLVTWMTPHVSEFLKTKTPVYHSIQEKCVENVRVKAEEEMTKETETREPIKIAGIEIPQEWQALLEGEAAEKADNLLEQNGVYQKLGDYIAGVIVNIMACLLSLFITVLTLRILVNVLDLVAKLPVLNSVNHIGGTVAGAAEGVIVVWILFSIITLCQSSEWGQQLLKDINQNLFLKTLYTNNVVEYILMHVIV